MRAGEQRGRAWAPPSLQTAQPLAYLFYMLNESKMSSEERILRLKKKPTILTQRFQSFSKKRGHPCPSLNASVST